MLTYGSLFSGIGGIDLGLDRAGFKCLWQVEKEEYARRFLAKHWPDAARYRDVRYFLGGKRWRQNREAWSVDLICGGFPCQDISNAGKRAGIDGERSGLWSEYVRIVRLLRPRFVLVENVAALLHRGLGRVLGDLAACGYDAEWDCLPACEFGADHERERTFIVAYPTGERREEPRIFGPNPSGFSANGVWQTTDALDAIRRRAVPALCRAANGVPNRVDRLNGLGNAVVPQVAEWIGRRLIDANKSESGNVAGSGVGSVG